ncbi:hypothetical protein TPA0598_02_07220 [Streptomyces lydicamycinicus]|uniref:Uncharacterized protein n=1 Tax=Streptomyces lydicamycinicus TaxID=1546107 RepID=A0A0P4R3U2_9ACTN|nr:hypothetical protein TPA0598_02_07220 [Streptomyces lydicamycinicus]
MAHTVAYASGLWAQTGPRHPLAGECKPGRIARGPYPSDTGSRLCPKPFHRVTAPSNRLTRRKAPTRVPRRRPVVAVPDSGTVITAASGKWLTGIAMSVAGATVGGE